MRDDTSTADLRGIAAARGILTARGGRTAHAAVVARQLGKACLVGCTALRIDLARRCVTIGEHCLHEGDTLTLDCASGHIYAGAVPVITERPDAWLSHYIPTKDRTPLVYWSRVAYNFLIPGVVGGMVLFVGTDFLRRVIDRRRKHHGNTHA